MVDDNLDILESTAELLEIRGFDVLKTNRAQDVSGIVQRGRPDLVLQDCHMPGLDLFELVPQIRLAAAPRPIRVLLYTASISADEFWVAVGADGLIRKPFEASHLERAIRELGSVHTGVASPNSTVSLAGHAVRADEDSRKR